MRVSRSKSWLKNHFFKLIIYAKLNLLLLNLKYANSVSIETSTILPDDTHLTSTIAIKDISNLTEVIVTKNVTDKHYFETTTDTVLEFGSSERIEVTKTFSPVEDSTILVEETSLVQEVTVPMLETTILPSVVTQIFEKPKPDEGQPPSVR